MTLKDARTAKGWTQHQLAVMASAADGLVTQQQVSRLESGEDRDPRYRLVVALCRALLCEPGDIDEFARGTR